jgi:hypothetical protein
MVSLTVHAMPAPKPALRYQLLPQVEELTPGNPAQFYLRCFMEQRNFFFSKEGTTERTRYLAMPLAQLPAEQLRHYGGSALTQADWGARLDTPDWEALHRVQNDGIDMLLPELGPLHILGTALRVRFRGQVAGRHFNEAIYTAKTMFALARHLGDHPTETANLLGLSIADLTLDSLEEMIQQPGSPNLYWALTQLPSPLVDLRKGLQGDRALVAVDFRTLRDDAPLTEEQLENLVSQLSGVMGFARAQAGLPPQNLRARLETLVKDSKRVEAARTRIMNALVQKEDLGKFPPLEIVMIMERVEKFPPLQVVLLDEKYEHDRQRDERMKLLPLAPWQIEALHAKETGAHSTTGLFAELLPNIVADRKTQARVEQRIGMLRCIEALRMYAAKHNGRLPATVDQVDLPLPIDPFTGKPVACKIERGTATIGHYQVIVQK